MSAPIQGSGSEPLCASFDVVATSPTWQLNGVNTLTVELIRGLRGLGIPARILLTEPHVAEPNPLPPPGDVPLDELPVARRDGREARWEALIRTLEERAPCIYLPNYDWRHSCISPRLSRRVGIVGIVHSDDPLHYEHVTRLGRYWNAIATVSRSVGEKVRQLDPSLAARVVTIPNGVSVPAELPPRRSEAGAPLRIVHAGRLVEHQKRVLDLPRIAEALLERHTPVELTIIGGGADAERLRHESRRLVERGAIRFLDTLPHERVLEVFERSDVFVLTSEFEGMPVALLEAMGRGCIPVTTQVASGIPELVREGVTGHRVPVGDVRAFAERLSGLQRDPALRQTLSQAAHRTILDGHRTQDMARSYAELFHRVLRESEAGSYQRPSGPILPPACAPQATRRGSWTRWLPGPVRAAGRYGRRALRQVSRGRV
jgi:glycosyltransferase involved in cell wall biosynthesis